VRRFDNPFASQKQESLGSADWLSLQLGGNGVANCSGWCSCKCPAHADDRASLSLKDAKLGLVVKCFAGCRPADIKAAILALRASGAFVHEVGIPARPAERSRVDLLQSAARIWHASQPIAGTLAEHYLRLRGITIKLPDVLRFHPALYHVESGTHAPAMVAVVQDVHGEKCAIHRTWLDPETGEKANLDPVRKSLCSITGCALRLSDTGLGRPEYEPLFVAEGIETALSVLQMFGWSTWSALSAPGLAALQIPTEIQGVWICGDDDEAGHDAADALTCRLQRQNPRFWVQQQYPSGFRLPHPVKDYNDALMLGARA
jgi:hypothetical protein